MKLTLTCDGRTEAGGSPLIMHSERLADPLDEFTQALAGISKKRNKTTADHEAMGHLEFGGGMYTDPPLTLDGYTNPNGVKFRPAIPAWNMLRCLQDGARRHKRGADVLRGVYPIGEYGTLMYDGPETPHELWQAGGFALRKTVGVQRARTVRTRPIFTDWRAELSVEVDASVFDVHTLRVIWREAGVYSGLGDMRPVYGRFVGAIVEAES